MKNGSIQDVPNSMCYRENKHLLFYFSEIRGMQLGVEQKTHMNIRQVIWETMLLLSTDSISIQNG